MVYIGVVGISLQDAPKPIRHVLIPQTQRSTVALEVAFHVCGFVVTTESTSTVSGYGLRVRTLRNSRTCMLTQNIGRFFTQNIGRKTFNNNSPDF